MTSALLDAKLAPPPWRPASQGRLDLVERVRLDDRQVVVVTAPAGYGKSTFLRQWAEREERPVAWVSLEATDDDEAVIIDYVARALERVGSLEGALAPDLTHARGALRTAALTRLAAAMWGSERPAVLMIDDVDQVQSTGSVDVLSWLSEHLPPMVRMAVASRARAPLPLARLRGRGRLLEVGPRELAISTEGARDLLLQVGVRVEDEQVAEVTRRTEGWAAGIYMTALSLRAGSNLEVAASATPADLEREEATERYVADFLRVELLERLSPELTRFLIMTSPLDRFEAALCDHVLGSQDSRTVLEELERTNAFLVPLDARSIQYRYHHLFRQVLVGELRRRYPTEEQAIQRRAAVWWAEHDELDSAVEYAHLAGDSDLVASLLVTHAFRAYRAGRLVTLDRWFGWFDADQLSRAPALATLGSFVFALSGRMGRSERWEDAVLPVLGELDARARAAFATVRSVTGRLPFEEQEREVRLAMDLLPPGDSFRATAFASGGSHRLMAGDAVGADVLLALAVEYGLDEGAIPAASAALALRAQVASLAGDWGHATELAGRARSLVREHRLESAATSAVTFGIGARVAIHAGDTATAEADISRMQRIRPTLTAAFPFVAARARLDLAHAYLGLGEVAGARLMLSEVGDIITVRPGVAPLAEEFATLRARAGGMGTGRPGVASLTTAELRLLGYLPSHLSFREIADRLFVSINTVKSQAISIYSKLGVSSRGGAIDAAVTTGLLDASATRFPSVAPELDPAIVGAPARTR